MTTPGYVPRYRFGDFTLSPRHLRARWNYKLDILSSFLGWCDRKSRLAVAEAYHIAASELSQTPSSSSRELPASFPA